MSQDNIHPILDKVLARRDKELLINQRGQVFWFTGLSGSGKSTIAAALEQRLHSQGYYVVLLDGDNMRLGISNNLGFSQEDRDENIRRIAEIAKLFKDNGAITLCSLISPTKHSRQVAKDIIGVMDFIEVYVDTPLAICEQRDAKGLYKKARAGEIKNFTGIDAPYETSNNPDVKINTNQVSVIDAVETLFHRIKQNINVE